MPARRRILGAILGFFLISSGILPIGHSGAAGADSSAQVLPRKILALYDSSEGDSETNNRVHRLAEIILNHLGLWVDYVDINAQRLPPVETPEYVGVITWFRDSAMANPENYVEWLEAWGHHGKKIVVLGNFGAFIDRKSGRLLTPSAVNRALSLLGAEARARFTDDPDLLEVAYKDSAMVEFERTLEGELRYYDQFVSVDPRNKVHLRLNRRDAIDGLSDVVFTGPGGGFALHSYEIHEDPVTLRRQWRLNPFRFFEEALQLGGSPRPDPTTLNGSRIFFAHIDGDGFNNINEQDRVSLSSEVITREIVEAYRLPTSVSIIVEDVDPTAKGTERALRAARRLLGMSNVEAASHTYRHPFNWNPLAYGEGSEVSEADPLLGKEAGGVAHALSDDLERDLAREIDESIDYINGRLLPPDKKVKLLFWSGKANPTANAVDRVDALGLKNINGGLGRFDHRFDSYAWLVPFVGQPGGRIQYYAPFNNDNVYTNLWSGPFLGFVQVIESFERTESPRRVTAINVYYHLYSGQKEASLRALKQTYEWAMAQEIAPVFASEYVDLLDGFRTTKIERLGAYEWRITENGSLRTLRVDDADLYPDLGRSQNVLGYTRANGSLYMHLGESNESFVALAEDPPKQPHLEKASHRLEGWTTSATRIEFVVSGIGTKTIVLTNLPASHVFPVLLENQGRQTMVNIRSDDSGRATVTTTLEGPVEVRISLDETDVEQPREGIAGFFLKTIGNAFQWIRGLWTR